MSRVKSPRRYNNQGRLEAAQVTRRRILDAARELFVERGYAATTIRATAECAGVAWQTVYAVFGTKAAILAAVFDVAVVGDDEPVAVADREVSRTAMAQARPRDLLTGFAGFVVGAALRTAPLFAVLEQAAPGDADIAELVAKVKAQKLHGMTRVAKALHERDALRPGITVNDARDVIAALTEARTVQSLTDNGWPPERIREWIVDAILRLLCKDGLQRL